jgi:response regulator RpfG family c-di-GMP phosphodiesterase
MVTLEQAAMNEPDQLPDATAPTAIPQPVLLFVDDEENIRHALRRLFRPLNYKILTAGSGEEALVLLENEPVDLVISDMRMPQMDGAQLLEQIRAKWPDTLRILLTGYADVGSTIAAINKGEIYRYIAKPWDDNDIILVVRHALERKALEREKRGLEQLTQRQNEELKALNASLEAKVLERTAELRQAMSDLEQTHSELKKSFITSVRIFSNLFELRAGRLAGHSRRVAELARSLAQHMGMSDAEIQDVVFAGLLHDIGKIGLSDRLLETPFPSLNNDERAQVMKHPAIGQAALMSLDKLKAAAELIGSHHERFDGLGYPNSLSGSDIPLGARILAVANEYDALQHGAMLSHRLSSTDAHEFIVKKRGQRYDPAVVDAFNKILNRGEPERAQKVKSVNLKSGMVLARDLTAPNGLLLLSHDYVLDASIIAKLHQFERHEGYELVLWIKSGA